MTAHEAAAATLPVRLSAGAANRRLLIAVALFSAVINLLMLTGPLFMLQVYDRVLVARSTETLTALFLLVVLLFAAMGALDLARGQVMHRVAARFQAGMEGRIFATSLAHPGDPAAAMALRDLEAVARLVAAPVLLALFDLPWVPVFFAAIFVFHPLLGWLALAGGAILIALACANQRLSAPCLTAALRAQEAADHMADELHREAELLHALGMRASALRRWQKARRQAGAALLRTLDIGGAFAVWTRTFRLFLQSAMLAAGAWVVLRGEMTGGAMIAASVLMGRALAPVEHLVAGWPGIVRGHDGWRRLARLLDSAAPEAARTALPRPAARLDVAQLTVVPPGAAGPTLRGLSFHLAPGQAVGVIGPSGAGKSTLARAICGYWPAQSGTIRLDGVPVAQFDADRLGQMIGYLPQRVPLLAGTIAENIARLSDRPDPGRIVAAARRAGAHRMILDLPDGYDTRLSCSGACLSGGQIQRIGLARALYGDPLLLILDEPDANLDNEGGLALNAAIRAVKAEGGIVLVMAHRPSAIAECDMLLMLEGGRQRIFGPREDVLRAILHNAGEVAHRVSAPGAA